MVILDAKQTKGGKTSFELCVATCAGAMLGATLERLIADMYVDEA